jgi:hypothetical protein
MIPQISFKILVTTLDLKQSIVWQWKGKKKSLGWRGGRDRQKENEIGGRRGEPDGKGCFFFI